MCLQLILEPVVHNFCTLNTFLGTWCHKTSVRTHCQCVEIKNKLDGVKILVIKRFLTKIVLASFWWHKTNVAAQNQLGVTKPTWWHKPSVRIKNFIRWGENSSYQETSYKKCFGVSLVTQNQCGCTKPTWRHRTNLVTQNQCEHTRKTLEEVKILVIMGSFGKKCFGV